MTTASDMAKSVSHEDCIYYFCSQKCLGKFRKNPEQYLQPKGTTSESTSRAMNTVLYTCRMHPEIEQNAPGICPLCGMALAPMDATEQADSSELEDMTRRFWISLGLSLPLFLLVMSDMIPQGYRMNVYHSTTVR
jgi:Cu+-exporting ATPase